MSAFLIPKNVALPIGACAITFLTFAAVATSYAYWCRLLGCGSVPWQSTSRVVLVDYEPS